MTAALTRQSLLAPFFARIQTMIVPLLDLDAQYRPLRDALLAAMTRVADSQRFIMGPEVEGLERELAARPS